MISLKVQVLHYCWWWSSPLHWVNAYTYTSGFKWSSN